MAKFTNSNPLVFTRKNRCKMCYTCVRECPVKAISIINGQANVITDRCIACGNCVRNCTQEAKIYYNSIEETVNILKSEKRKIAIVAPSFVAEFIEIENYKQFVGMIKALGFDDVIEVSFGADMIANEYRNLLSKSDLQIISSDCPAVAFYIMHYMPELVTKLAPIVSPMVATGRIMRKKYGEDVNIVFISPCIAKKAESQEINAVLTFTELRQLFASFKIFQNNVTESDWDEPKAGSGAFLPISRGLMQNISKNVNVGDNDIIVTDGYINFREALMELSSGHIKSQYTELLCCEGCIMGPGMSKNGRKFQRRNLVKSYANEKVKNLNVEEWEKNIEKYSDVDFSTHFENMDRRASVPERKEIDIILKNMGKSSAEDYLNCGACGYATCEEHAIAIFQGLAEIDMCLPETIKKLHSTIEELHTTNGKLANTQQQLNKSEKLAHMGQLSAGIAHELNNPLGVITMYSNLLKEEIPADSQLFKDLELIAEQANRCKVIVGGLLNFARKNQVKLTETDINEFVKHSLSSVIIPNNITTSFSSEIDDTLMMIDAEQMMQVLTNVEKNAIEAMPDGGELKLIVKGNDKEIEINISDTGTGVEKENMDKLFTPFFTTKEIGKGTGLGLPIVYGIVKMHKGKIDVISNVDKSQGPTGTTFKITLPKNMITDKI